MTRRVAASPRPKASSSSVARVADALGPYGAPSELAPHPGSSRGAPRRSRTSGRRAPASSDRVDTTPLDVPRPVTEPMPVIFLTAEPPSDDVIVRGLDLGAYDFLTKDCSRAELLAQLPPKQRMWGIILGSGAAVLLPRRLPRRHRTRRYRRTGSGPFGRERARAQGGLASFACALRSDERGSRDGDLRAGCGPGDG